MNKKYLALSAFVLIITFGFTGPISAGSSEATIEQRVQELEDSRSTEVRRALP
jgi:hypothetical protein